MAQNITLTGGVSNTPEGSIQEQTPSKYESENIRIFFDTVTDDSLNFQSQITDNYVENIYKLTLCLNRLRPNWQATNRDNTTLLFCHVFLRRGIN